MFKVPLFFFSLLLIGCGYQKQYYTQSSYKPAMSPSNTVGYGKYSCYEWDPNYQLHVPCNATPQQIDYIQTEENMKSWVGAHKSKLIQAAGAPNRYASDGNNGQILIYETSKQIAITIYGNYMSKVVTYYQEFFANSSGIIYHYRLGSR